MDALSIDQFAVFATVVEEGSFTAAARRMNRGQSAITYAIQKLEDQSGVTLFDRSAYRSVLTEAGRALLPRAQRILAELDEYRLHARLVAAGLEDEVRLAVPPFSSHSSTSDVFRQFREVFPSVRITASIQATNSAREALENERVELALMLDVAALGDTFESAAFASLSMVAVASPNHPLAQFDRTLSAEDFRGHTLLLVHGVFNAQDENVAREFGATTIVNAWRIVDFEMMRQLLISGVGWGVAPRDRVESDLAAGHLVTLRLAHRNPTDITFTIPIVVARLKTRPLGPAGRWLFDRFKGGAID